MLYAVAALTADEPAPELTIDGAPKVLSDNISAHLDISTEDCNISPVRRRLLLQNLNRNIQRAAHAVGYYDIRYSSEIKEKEECWALHLSVQPGEPVKVEKVDIQLTGSGSTDPVFMEYLKSDVPVKTGDRLNHSDYEKIKTGLSRIAAARGYLQAVFSTAELRIDVGDRRAEIVLRYDTGPRMQFGEVRFPETVLSGDVLKRYQPFQSGDPYDIEQMNQLQRVLDNSQYFSRVKVQPLPEQTVEDRVPVDVELVPRKQHGFVFGVGAATDTGPRLKFEYENRYLNDRGHRLNYDLRLSPVRSETRLNYMLPLIKPATQHLDIYTGYMTEDTDTADQDTYTLGAGYTRQSKSNWLQTVFLNYQREEFRVAGVTETTDLLIPGISWSKISADDTIYPLHGWRLQTRLRAASEDLVSDTTFYQAYAAVKTIYKVGPGRVLFRVEAGKTEADDFNVLPVSVRFFAGGDNSVRGYGYESLGPVNDNGEVVGGANLLVGSFEYDIRVTRHWALAAFYDQGNAFNGSLPDYRRGAGLGLRWLSPIGPIRIDIATALDNDNEIRLHLSMGPDL